MVSRDPLSIGRGDAICAVPWRRSDYAARRVRGATKGGYNVTNAIGQIDFMFLGGKGTQVSPGKWPSPMIQAVIVDLFRLYVIT